NVFEQKGVEVPKFWSATATNVVASKYFRGKLTSPDREWSVKQLIDRVVNRIASFGLANGYFSTEYDRDVFAAELTYVLVHQMASFNSPVWFNVGVPGAREQPSACFILSVEDDMGSILDWFKNEGVIFKGGSGAGVNVSNIRSSREQLSGGGWASGPVSFMRGADSVAGSIKSGGTTRRAAKMVVMNADHPDIHDFVWCKAKEEKKAWALGEAGYDMSLNGEAWQSIQFQNANNSVRVTDEFMKKAIAFEDWQLTARVDGRVLETVKANALLREISEATWQCGDPGLQFDTTCNDWHTRPNTGRNNATNPCAEFVSLDNTACNLASLNLMRFVDANGDFDVAPFVATVRVVFTAQEILVALGEYPTPEITKNAHANREIGMGYANLGALLMQRGFAYDSNEGRAYAAAITALMTGEAYAQSARIAAVLGPYAEYERNKTPHDRVVDKHRTAAYRIVADLVQPSLLSAARQAWDDAVGLGKVHGYRNAQASVLAPTGCLVGDSLISTSRGLVRLRSLGDTEGAKWQKLDIDVATDDGEQQATRFFVNGSEAVVSVATARGYRIQGTPTHRIKVVEAAGNWVWRRFSELRKGDRVPLMLNGMVGKPRSVALPPLGELYWTADRDTRVPREVTPDLAEFVGYFMGDGSLHAKGLRMCVTDGDVDVMERITQLGHKLFGLEGHFEQSEGNVNLYFNSVPLTMWWEACGFAKFRPTPEHAGKGWLAHIPDAILYSNDRYVYAAFLRGLFEADGGTWGGYASFSTVNDRLARDVQTMMLALGFVTTRKVDDAGSNWGPRDRYVVRLLNVAAARRFIDEIGFISKRKTSALLTGDHRQASRMDHIPLTRWHVDEHAPVNDSLRKTMLMSLATRGDVSRRSATALLERTHDEDIERLLGFYYDEIDTIEVLEDQPTFDLSVPRNLTYVANGFVSHNTISFMMDCDTTGVEPDIALVKYKRLVGGGMLKMVNGTVPAALRRLGYTETDASAITAYIEQQGTIEGAPGLKEDHLPVFDCAFKPQNGVRSIHHLGHIKMMGAVQPFISGAISKTVNLPETATVDDVAEAYIEAWKHGVKAIAIYRDGSKKVQPVSTNADASNSKKQIETVTVEKIVEVDRPARRRLPTTRESLTHKFSIEGHEGYITVGKFEDGTPGELFVTMAKEGSTLSGMMDAFATSVSLLFQYGVPLSHLVEKFGHMRFEPSGWTGNPQIGMAKSIVDYVFRWLGHQFLSAEEKRYLGLVRTTEIADASVQQERLEQIVAITPPAITENFTAARTSPVGGTAMRLNSTPDAPPCPRCGWLTVRSGTCHKCENCGETTGCS
ncbi:MAG TPA: LAGLIDADG family homing endonuclease, partial [Candidatus Limnocylindria bacterium]|nr:LAGLIDADG family homing endonuclease [Candidatus Limnocylindria bacterium]